MAGKVEIIIKKEIILAQSEKLEKIAQSVEEKKICVFARNSKGKTAESINSLIEELNLIGTALSKLMFENADNVRAIAEQFSEIDSDIASAMGSEQIV